VQIDVESNGYLADHRGAGLSFATPYDGGPGRIQIGLWGDVAANRDGAFDKTLILHEYTHFLSWRLVGGGHGASGSYVSSLQEGWSDFYSLALSSEPGGDLLGTYQFSAFAGYHYWANYFNQNYY